MLLNLSNHHSSHWSEKQHQDAQIYGQVTDMPFPAINPSAETPEIELLTESYEVLVMKMFADHYTWPNAVHLMGEMTFCLTLVSRLQKAGIQCLVSTSKRQAFIKPGGSKVSRFEFVKFRAYPKI